MVRTNLDFDFNIIAANIIPYILIKARELFKGAKCEN